MADASDGSIPSGRSSRIACPEEKLVIELDGGQHAERKDRDAARTQWLADRGYRVLRFWNNEVLAQTDAVVQVIAAATGDAAGAPLPNPPPANGGGRKKAPMTPFRRIVN